MNFRIFDNRGTTLVATQGRRARGRRTSGAHTTGKCVLHRLVSRKPAHLIPKQPCCGRSSPLLDSVEYRFAARTTDCQDDSARLTSATIFSM